MPKGFLAKISAADNFAVLKEASATINKAADMIEELRAKVAHYERQDYARKIASKMDNEMRGGEDVETFAQKLASTQNDLTVIEKAVDLRTQDPKLASIGEISHFDYQQGVPVGQAKQMFNAWLMAGSSPYDGL